MTMSGKDRGGGALAALAAGAASGALYLSVLLSSLFLVPVQTAFGRFGRRTGIMAAGAAVLVVGASQALTFTGASGVPFWLALLGSLPVLALAGGLVLVNASFWARLRGTWRVLATAGLLSLIAAPFVVSIAVDPAFKADLERLLASTLSPLFQAASGSGGGSAGYDEAAIALTLVPGELVGLWISVLGSSFAALILAAIGGSWWLGSRVAAARLAISATADPGQGGVPEGSLAPSLREYRVPAILLWPLLAAWAALGMAILLEAPFALEAAAWNAALSLALFYAAQGFGIAASLLDRLGMPRGLRLALGVTAFALLAMEPAGALAVAAFPLLGVTEAWIPYRTRKGVGA